MIIALLHPEILTKIRADNELKVKLAEISNVRMSAINARLRPQAEQRLPHSPSLTDIICLKAIAKHLKVKNVEELYEVMSID